MYTLNFTFHNVITPSTACIRHKNEQQGGQNSLLTRNTCHG